MLRSTLLLLLNLNLIKCQKPKFEGFIVQGQNADIRMASYSAFLFVSKSDDDEWICGGSILNQDLILTAAHCLYDSEPKHVFVRTGHVHRHRGHLSTVFEFIIHHLYRDEGVAWDIGIMKLSRPVMFSDRIGRVAIMQYPPYWGKGTIAGWGSLDDFFEDDGSHVLQVTEQYISNRTVCQWKIGDLPMGTICGGDFYDRSYPSRGDSGSALVVRNFIQVGIVSFKRMQTSRSIIVYSDVGYYYQWIVRNAHHLCVLKKEADRKSWTTQPPQDLSISIDITESSEEVDFFYQIFPSFG